MIIFKKIFRFCLFSFYLLLVVVTLLELALRLYYDDPNYWFRHRYLYVSENAWQNQRGFWTYTPNMAIRVGAVYGFPAPEHMPRESFVIEYDHTFPTNRFGLQGEDIHYQKDRPTVLILGDSFTEGHGGGPWLQHLVDKFPKMNLLNGGLQSTGIESFVLLFQHLTDLGVEPTKLVVIAISNDFKRKPHEWGKGIMDCLNSKDRKKNCLRKNWYPITLTTPADTLVEISQERSRQKNKKMKNGEKWVLFFERYLYLFKFMPAPVKTQISEKLFHRKVVKKKVQSGPTKNNISAIKSLAAKGLGLEVILVPQRDEVAKRQINDDSKEVVMLLDAEKINYTWCNLAQGDYMELDGHPNAKGYQKLAECLEKRLYLFRDNLLLSLQDSKNDLPEN